MKNSGEAILADIDSTLDQLIRNADAMNRITDRHLFTCEVKAMHKTQESLLARLMHMHEIYENEKKNLGEREQKMRLTSIEHKLAEYGRLNARMIKYLESGMQAKPKVAVRPSRKKSRAAA
ncbi:MAG TPA: hypothetical protein VGJ00_00650 [Rhabdochlamydiaceae bacterium]|jgi:hypothetical protein